MLEKLQKKMENFVLFSALTEFDKKPDPDPARALELQNRNLKKTIEAAYKLPFYKERFDRAGVKPEDITCGDDLVKLPLLTKDELRAWMKEEAAKPEHKEWFHDTTSGSSGVPLTILLSPREKAYMKANWIRVLMKAGYNPVSGKTMSRINAHDAKSGGRDTVLQHFGILRHCYINQYAPEPEVILAINAYKPDMLYLNKTEFMRIALYARRHGMKVYHPKFYAPVGEKTDDVARKLFIETFGPGLMDSYGSAETGACMLRAPGREDYQIHYDSFVVNLYDDEGKLADEGKVVITPLLKQDMPLINYVIGDRAESKIIDGLRHITYIQGRMNDFFRYETGEVTTFFEITPVIAHSTDVLQIRFIQDTYEHVRVQIVRDDENSCRSREEIEEYLSAEFNRIMKYPMNFDYEWMDVIQPEANGKLRMIVCEIKEEE